MTRAPLPLLCLLLAACGGRADVGALQAGPGDTPAAPAPTPTPTPDPEPEPGFGVSVSGLEVRSPVVAVTPEGRRYLAAIVEPEGYPAFLEGDRVIRFPGAGGDARDLAMVAGPRGMLHAAWTTDTGALFYGRIEPEASRRTAVEQLQASDATGPNLAVSEDGEVFVAFVQGWISREPRQSVAAYRGWVENGFRGPERVMPQCCDTYTGDAWNVRIGTVHFDNAGLVHLAYSWFGDSMNTDYVAQGRGWYLGRRVTGAGNAGPPALVQSADGLGLVTMNEAATEVWWHPLNRREADRALYETEGLMAAQARAGLDPQGRLQLVVSRIDGTTPVIEHVTFDDEGARVEEMARAEAGEGLWMTPGAGGMALTEQGPIVPYLRSFGRVGSRLEVAAPAGAE